MPARKRQPYCIQCGYPLREITSRECPECGLPFNPDQPETYRTTPISRRERMLVGNCLLLCAGVMLITALIKAWDVLAGGGWFSAALAAVLFITAIYAIVTHYRRPPMFKG